MNGRIPSWSQGNQSAWVKTHASGVRCIVCERRGKHSAFFLDRHKEVDEQNLDDRRKIKRTEDTLFYFVI